MASIEQFIGDYLSKIIMLEEQIGSIVGYKILEPSLTFPHLLCHYEMGYPALIISASTGMPVEKFLRLTFFSGESLEKICINIQEELERFHKLCFKKKRILDLRCFNNIASCINWRKLFKVRDKINT